MAKQIQWYPGHMAKAQREIESKVKLVDIVIELVDARAPFSTHNPELDYMIKNKPRLYILTKKDLADPKATDALIAEFKRQGHSAIAVDLKNFKEEKKIVNMCRYQLKEKREKEAARGLKPKPIRALVAGIPNVGKSTFINSYAGKACAKTGNKPGVTKGKQWIRLNKTLELLDTPGILWPKFEDQEVGKRLAFIGSIKDEILNLEELSLELLDYIRTNYPGLLNTRYGIEEEGTPVSLLEAVADKRKCLIRGQEIDYAKAAGIVMEEFRNGKIGRITLEFPPVEEETAHEDHPGD